jgi:excisionase family DNA binding protein
MTFEVISVNFEKEDGMAKKLITLSEAAKFLKVKDNVVQEMINSGVFAPVKSGRTVKVDKLEIEEWLAHLSESEEEHLALRRTVCRFEDYIEPGSGVAGFNAETNTKPSPSSRSMPKSKRLCETIAAV